MTSSVSDNVRAEVARARVTQAELAKRLDISQQAISAKLAGHSTFTVPQLLAIADVLGVPAASLLPAAVA